MTQTTLSHEQFHEIFYEFLHPKGVSLEAYVDKLIQDNQLESGLLDKITRSVDRGVELLSQSQVTSGDLDNVAYEYATAYAVAIQNLSQRGDLDRVITLGERSISELQRICNDVGSSLGYAIVLVADAYRANGSEKRANQLYRLSIKLAEVYEDDVTIVKANRALGRKKGMRKLLFRRIVASNGEEDEEVNAMLDLFTEKEIQELIDYSEGCVEQKVLLDYKLNNGRKSLCKK